MQYKTIVLELLAEQCPTFQRRLQAERMLLKAVETYASILKANHEAWTDRLADREAVDRAEPDRVRRPGTGDHGAPGGFALRVAPDRRPGGTAFPRRSDGLYQESYAARVKAARAGAAQPLLPFGTASSRTEPQAEEPPADSIAPRDFLPSSTPVPLVVGSDGKENPPPEQAFLNGKPHDATRLNGSKCAGPYGPARR